MSLTRKLDNLFTFKMPPTWKTWKLENLKKSATRKLENLKTWKNAVSRSHRLENLKTHAWFTNRGLQMYTVCKPRAHAAACTSWQKCAAACTFHWKLLGNPSDGSWSLSSTSIVQLRYINVRLLNTWHGWLQVQLPPVHTIPSTRVLLSCLRGKLTN